MSKRTRQEGLEYDYTEYERLLGEFLRIYIEVESLQVEEKLKVLGGYGVQFLRQRKHHKYLRNRVSHCATLLYRPENGSWRPCLISPGWNAQVLFGPSLKALADKTGEDFRGHIDMAIKGGRDFGGRLTTMTQLKSAIGEMALGIAVACTASNTGCTKKRYSKQSKRKVIEFTPLRNAQFPGTHVARIWNAETHTLEMTDHYDGGAKGLDLWRELDCAVGKFLRKWSQITVALRQLEIIINNPHGPVERLDISTQRTDMKRAHAVLGRDHSLVKLLEKAAKEKSIILRGRRRITPEVKPVIVLGEARGGGWAVAYAQHIGNISESLTCPTTELSRMVNKQKAKWIA